MKETIVVPARVDQLPAVHGALERFWSAVESVTASPPRGDWRHRFSTAVAEIAGNIMRHAHPPNAPPGVMRLQLRYFTGQAVARFSDRGVAFEGTLSVPYVEPVEHGMLPEGGYGLRLAHAALDRLEYRRTTSQMNFWRLIKRLS